MSSFKVGVISAVVAQVLWGLFPVYWKWLSHVNSFEVLTHRNLWSAVFLSLLVLISAKRRAVVKTVLSNRREVGRHLLSACLIASNWLVFIWAIAIDKVVDASLGYFLSPLVSVALGYLVFRERLNTYQLFAIALAATGVLIMVVASGLVPWIGLSLATTFGLYGMIRKKGATGPINGLFIETLLLVPFSLILMLWIDHTVGLYFSAPFTQLWDYSELLMFLGGLVTAIPLILFAQGARNLPLSLSGLLVYLTPSIQFLIGWLYYREPIDTASWVGFVCIWSALVVYSLSVVVQNRSADSDAQIKAGK